jgi:hypothetical protein
MHISTQSIQLQVQSIISVSQGWADNIYGPDAKIHFHRVETGRYEFKKKV